MKVETISSFGRFKRGAAISLHNGPHAPLFASLLSEIAHCLVVEAGAYEALKSMLDKLDPNDLKEREMVSRAITALEPDGWRGIDYGLQEEVGNQYKMFGSIAL